MSVYSELLHKYIEERNVKIVKLIEYCGLDRSSMYKIINGKRKVTNVEIARKIANYMQLSPKECELYYEAYYRSTMGEEEYEQKQQIEEFIYNFNHIYRNASVYLEKKEMEIEPLNDATIHMLEGKTEINQHLRMILEKAAQNRKTTIQIVAQYDNRYLQEILLHIGSDAPDMKIQHILCFQKQGEHTKENIELLKHSIPFYGCECQYEPYYYYDEINSHFYNMNLFCNVVICDEGVLCYTSDYRYGQLLRDKDCIQTYKQLFEQYRAQTYPLFVKMESALQQYMLVGKEMLNGFNQVRAHALQAEPCIVPFVSDMILRKQVKESLPQREEIIALFRDFIKEERELFAIGNACCTFTVQGVEQFILSGVIEEIPQEFYNPLPQKECIELVKKMLPYFEKGYYRLLKNQLAQMSNNLHIFVSPTNGHFLFSKNNKEMIFVRMNEVGMIEQFLSFMEDLNEELALYSPSEAVSKINALIEKYEN